MLSSVSGGGGIKEKWIKERQIKKEWIKEKQIKEKHGVAGEFFNLTAPKWT